MKPAEGTTTHNLRRFYTNAQIMGNKQEKQEDKYNVADITETG